MAIPLGDTLIASAGEVPEFRIRLIHSGGRTVRQICRAAEPADVADLAVQHPASPPANIPRITRLFTGTDGRIWAQRTHGNSMHLLDRDFGPPGATFDVLESDGVFVGRVQAPDGVLLVAASGTLVFGLREDSGGLTSLIAFRIQ